MPYPFTLPTTAFVPFSNYFSSNTHPSLPLAATNSRAVVRDGLKKHKRLAASERPSHLPFLLAALNAYLPHLFALEAGLSGRWVAGEEVHVVLLLKELELQWSCTLASTIPGQAHPRVKSKSIESEVFFTLQTLASIHSLLARSQLLPLHQSDAPSPSPEQRAQAIAGAMKNLLTAHSIHAYLAKRSNNNNTTTTTTSQFSHSATATAATAAAAAAAAAAVDIAPPVLATLASLALSEATLITVLKDDPYPFAVADERNKNSTDWMFKAPDIPTVRANLFARLCMASAEHASQGAASARNAKGLTEDLTTYADDLRRTARAKAARFLAIDAEGQGRAGEAIAWIRGAKKELGFTADEEGKLKGLSKLKKDWKEKREDKRLHRGDADWGSDAGKLDESRVLDMLEKKWVKMNDTMNVQLIPPSAPLLTSLPSGREYHRPQDYIPPTLEEDALARMRAPPDPTDTSSFRNDDDSASDLEAGDPVGAFPGTKQNYTSPGTSNYY